MMANGKHRDGDERFKELAALSNSGTVSASEWLELKQHLRICEECRQIHDEYQLLTSIAMPLLAAAYDNPPEREDWDDSRARESLLARVTEGETERLAAGTLMDSVPPPHLRWKIAANPC